MANTKNKYKLAQQFKIETQIKVVLKKKRLQQKGKLFVAKVASLKKEYSKISN